jgi:PAS domain-containing protein
MAGWGLGAYQALTRKA